MAVFVTVAAFVAWYTALDRLGAHRAGLLLGTVAVTALATTALVGTATITPTAAVGCALVFAGVAIGVRAAPRQHPTPPARAVSHPEQPRENTRTITPAEAVETL